MKFISILLIDSRGSIFACFWCFLLGALQFVIRIVGRGYFDWNYSIVHRRSPAPRRELPREPVPVPTSDLRAEARRLQPAAAIRSSGAGSNKIADLPVHAHALPARRACSDRAATHWQNGQRPRGEPAATVPQKHSDCKANAQQSRCNRACIYMQIYRCMYPIQPVHMRYGLPYIWCIQSCICTLYVLQIQTHISIHMCVVCASDTCTYALAGSLMPLDPLQACQVRPRRAGGSGPV